MTTDARFDNIDARDDMKPDPFPEAVCRWNAMRHLPPAAPVCYFTRFFWMPLDQVFRQPLSVGQRVARLTVLDMDVT